MMCDTWTLAVLGLMVSSVAISRLEYPRATRRSTWSSREVSPRGTGSSAAGAGTRLSRAILARRSMSCCSGRAPSSTATRYASRAGGRGVHCGPTGAEQRGGVVPAALGRLVGPAQPIPGVDGGPPPGRVGLSRPRVLGPGDARPCLGVGKAGRGGPLGIGEQPVGTRARLRHGARNRARGGDLDAVGLDAKAQRAQLRPRAAV